MDELIIKTQAEFDGIQDDFSGYIYFENGNNLIIVNRRFTNARLVARENSSVMAWENSYVEARENSYVVARENSYVVAWGNSSVEARGNSSVVARENSYVEARENSYVVARENSYVVAWGNSSVEAWDNSYVEAWDNSSVEARENSSVVAWGNSSVEAWDNSSVEARENSSVMAWDNSSVDLCGFSQARIMSRFVDYKTANKARVILPFETIEDFAEYYGIDIVDGKVKMYKAVHAYSGKYTSNRCDSFHYKIGETAKEPSIDTDTYDDCGAGLHISTLKFALGFGNNWRDLAILEVEADVKDLVVPKLSDGKIRTSRLTVLREVPLEECGVYGKILAKRRER